MCSASIYSGLTPEYEVLIKLYHGDEIATDSPAVDAMDDLDYIMEKSNNGYELTDHGKEKAIEVQQQVEKTNYTILSIGVAAAAAGIGSLSNAIAPFGLLIFAVFIIVIVLLRNYSWSNVN